MRISGMAESDAQNCVPSAALAFKRPSGQRWTKAEIEAVISRAATEDLDHIAKSVGTSYRKLVSLLRRNYVSIRQLKSDREACARGGRTNYTGWSQDTPIPGHSRPYLGYGMRAIATKPASGCSWPIGDPQKEGFVFCGRRRKDGSSYCGMHDGVAWER